MKYSLKLLVIFTSSFYLWFFSFRQLCLHRAIELPSYRVRIWHHRSSAACTRSLIEADASYTCPFPTRNIKVSLEVVLLTLL